MSAKTLKHSGKPPDVTSPHGNGHHGVPVFLSPLPKQCKAAVSSYKEKDDIEALLSLISCTPPKQQLAPLEKTPILRGGTTRLSRRWPAPLPAGASQSQQHAAEASALENFSSTHQNDRNFTDHAHHSLFTTVFSTLVEQRLKNIDWCEQAPPINIYRILVCLRILMRDEKFQQDFHALGGVQVLSTHLQQATDSYLTYGDGPYVVDIVKEMTNICQKLSAVVEQREWLIASDAHKALVLLLSSTDVIVLHCTLYALISLAQSPEPRRLIAELNSIEILLRILQDYDMMSRKLAANLLRQLCGDSQAREMIKVYDGLPILLSLLHNDSVTLLWNVVWCLVQLANEREVSNDIRIMGGVPLLLSLLHDRKFVSDRTAANTSPGLSPGALKSPAIMQQEELFSLFAKEMGSKDCTTQVEELREHQLALKSATCTCLTELCLNDNNVQHLVQANGVYLIALLILPPVQGESLLKAAPTLQANAFRALRFLFSMERNRRLFKTMFPPSLFEKFIDIGHYIHDIGAYKELVEMINGLPQESLDEIRSSIASLNQNKAPSHHIGDYAVIEHLGSGAFGSVYKVKKKSSSHSYLAMKEINSMNPALGKSLKDREKSIGDIVSELNIIREHLKHPNIVKYYKTFVEVEKLYVVMEYIEGAPLGEHFTSLKEKGERFSEERIWKIFVQMVLGLRYLHKEKHIVHRDLTPNNIMLGENDKVTITDFGLAKQKQQDCSKMTSVVGTILYSCPELIQSQPYGEKADVWALGCILYQMCTLSPPFYSTNMLHLATKIVEADYEPLPEGLYSDKVTSTIRKCITANPDDRPDIVAVAGHLAEVILVYMDNLQKEHSNMEKKLERERRRTQKTFREANHKTETYHRMYLVSQARYDRLANLKSSGGAQSLKDEIESADSVFTEEAKTDTSIENEYPVISENGWASDDDLGSSSGSDSRESSAGLMRAHARGVLQPHPPSPAPYRQRRKPRHEDSFSSLSALTVDIAIKCSRDSGLSSGDPSPNTTSPPGSGTLDRQVSVPDGDRPRPKSFSTVQRSSSSNALDSIMKRPQRPNSAGKATLSISPRRVREISDPILQMLHTLHKIIYITQLAPTLCHNPRRRIIERFKRALFGHRSTSVNLKNELKKLINGSRELIDLDFGPTESLGLAKQISKEQETLKKSGGSGGSRDIVYDTDAEEVGITYEQMQCIIESVLVESSYYDVSPSVRHRHSAMSPLAL